MLNQYATPLLQNEISKDYVSSKKKIALCMKNYFNQDFPQLNLKINTKTMTYDYLYLYGALC